ncbi:TonB-dependent receptor [Phenylobacterium sp. LjRoot219]|uniref:TonB-dependent receptor n=1 Tax=Phenylobacterium sp. LjRoot219 TaxID=3342283 RepID=UPI003ED09AF8
MLCIRKRIVLCATTALAGLISAAPAGAQPAGQAAEQTQLTEVIVTARKRQESLLQVPVIETVISAEQLDRFQVTDLTDLPKLAPGLNLGHALLSIGTQISIRGVGTSSSDPGVDQSVSLNIDGLSLGQGLAFQSAMFDLGQVEILRGPQALFYGKSSPGGVISLTTADPTDRFELIARAGYEFVADERRGELIISGPVTDTLKARLSGMYSQAEGYFTNDAVAVTSTGAVDPYRREPRPRSYVVRATLLWNPTEKFDARMKFNLVHDRAIDAETQQLTSCPDGVGSAPFGIPFIGGDDCKLDKHLRVVYMNPATFPGVPNNGVPFLENNQKYGTVELNYQPLDYLGVTSTTAIYQLSSKSMVNTTHTTAAAPTLVFDNRFKRRDFTQELRLNSDFENPVNFTLGAFYQDGRINDRVVGRGNPNYRFPAFVMNGLTSVDIKTYSVFGQLRWKITPELELAGGARWTDEKRSEQVENFLTGRPVVVPVAVPSIRSKNTAPEVTLTYTPTSDLTIFGAYKRGYKSGSFSIATITPPGGNNAFGDEKVKGGEIGVKSRLLDRQVALNVAAYDYRYTGLQVGAIEPSVGGVPVIRTVNAGSARTYGIDIDAAYRPAAIKGLGLSAALNWNRGRYKTLNNVPCYGGQTIAAGCNRFLNPNTGLFTAQDLSGTPLIRAPEWQANFGFDYDFPVGHGLTVALGNNNQYSSKYVTFLATGRPNNDNYQDGYLKVDVSAALRGPDNRWELALVGKNITDKLTSGNCSPSNYAGGIIGGQVTGGTGAGIAGIDEVACYTDVGRSVWLRLTVRPFN